jgi:hypothetical protein
VVARVAILEHQAVKASGGDGAGRAATGRSSAQAIEVFGRMGIIALVLAAIASMMW